MGRLPECGARKEIPMIRVAPFGVSGRVYDPECDDCGGGGSAALPDGTPIECNCWLSTRQPKQAVNNHPLAKFLW